jgi:hypothetical protein
MHACNLSEGDEHFIKEKSQPDAFAFALLAHQVHAVVPVTGTDKRQAVFTKAEAPQDSPETVFVQEWPTLQNGWADRNTSLRPRLPGGLRGS